ncbi:hypothetical protein L9F63_003320, partial [Diploptera punctata]
TIRILSTIANEEMRLERGKHGREVIFYIYSETHGRKGANKIFTLHSFEGNSRLIKKKYFSSLRIFENLSLDMFFISGKFSTCFYGMRNIRFKIILT